MMWRVTGLARKDTAPESRDENFFENCDSNHSAGRGPVSSLSFGRFEVNGACHGKTKVAVVALDRGNRAETGRGIRGPLRVRARLASRENGAKRQAACF